MTLDEMWERLAQHQPYADQRGYGPEWARMCEERTPEAAEQAADVAWAAVSLTAVGAVDAARVASDAARVAWEAPWVASDAAWAACSAAVKWIEKAEGKNNERY